MDRRLIFVLFLGLAACPPAATEPPEPPPPASRPGKLLVSGGIRGVKASADGRWISFFNGGTQTVGDLYLASPSGGLPRALAANVEIRYASFSADGSALAFLTDTGTDSTATLAGGPVDEAPRALASRVPLGGWQWIQRGPRMLVVTGFDRGSRLGTLALHDAVAGTRTEIGSRAPFEVSASADGRQVAARHSLDLASGLGTLVVEDADASSATVISQAASWAFALSPDGLRLAWADPQRTLRIVGRDGSGATELTASDVWLARFSPDGARVGWIDTLGVRSGIVDSGARFLLHDPAVRIGLDFSADSNWILFHEFWDQDQNLGDLFLAGAEGQGEVLVGEKTYFGSWRSAPGSSVVAASTSMALVPQVGAFRGAVSVADGSALTVKTVGESVFEALFEWSPDGQELAFVDKLDLDTFAGKMMVWSRRTQAAAELSAKGVEGSYAWTPAGGLLFIASLDTDPTHATYGTGELWYRPPGGEPVKLDQGVGDFAVVAGQPMQVAYSVYVGPVDESGLYVMPLP